MDSLKNLISKFGEPDALIDHWDNQSKRIAIWGFDEIFIYNNNGCYLNGKKIKGDDPLELCNKILNLWSSSSSSSAYAIGYISYDMKNDLFPHLKLKEIGDQTLMWFGKPQLIKEYNLDNEIISDDLSVSDKLSIIKEIPDINTYIENTTRCIQKDRGLAIPNCPIKVDFEVGPTWGNLSEYK